jgi:hypothetical protein
MAQTEEAVGINTENPQGVLHIDAASTTATTNPQTGTVGAAQAVDDVVVDAEGRLGVGVAAPAARVDIYDATPGGALRIADGTQGQDKVLVSEADGTGRWKAILPAVLWYAALYRSAALGYTGAVGTSPFTTYNEELISSTSQGSLDGSAGTITVPSKGKYRITFGTHYMTNRTADYPYWAVSALQVNGTNRWTPSVWGTRKLWGTDPFFLTVLNLNAGDVLRLALVHEQSFSANYGWVTAFMAELIQITQ